MFKRKNKCNDKSSCQSENYRMKDNYDVENLVSANLKYVSSSVTPYGPMDETTDIKYIFEVIKENDKIRYREVCTGFVADTENYYFDLPYAINIKPLVEDVTTDKHNVSKNELLLLIHKINEPQKMKVK